MDIIVHIGAKRGAGRWGIYSPEQRSTPRERYDDEMFWLQTGANGLATLTEEHSSGPRHQARTGQ